MAKSVLITGCSEGTIGNALAIEFARRGWRVYASARKTSSMSNLVGLENVITIPLDITNRNSVVVVRDQIERETGGKLDVLYHNAGVRHGAMAIDSNSDNYIDDSDASVFETNVTAVMAATRIFAPQVIAARGTIAFTGSVSSRMPQPGSAAYNASKAALEMYSRILRIEMKPFGVKVVYVMTALVRSNMSLQRVVFPENSLYRPIEAKINDGLAAFEEDAMDAAKYSRYVVGRVTRESPPEIIWQGSGSWSVWLVELLGLQWVYPRYFRKQLAM